MLRYLLLAAVLFGGALGIAQVAWQPLVGANCDRGSIIDPNGCPAPQVDRGSILDPDGLN